MQSINIKKLEAKKVDELLVYSICQSLYTVRIVMDGEYFDVKKMFKRYRAFSMGQIHSDFSHCQIKRLTLIQQSAYDEMIGQPIKVEDNALVISSPVDATQPTLQ